MKSTLLILTLLVIAACTDTEQATNNQRITHKGGPGEQPPPIPPADTLYVPFLTECDTCTVGQRWFNVEYDEIPAEWDFSAEEITAPDTATGPQILIYMPVAKVCDTCSGAQWWFVSELDEIPSGWNLVEETVEDETVDYYIPILYRFCDTCLTIPQFFEFKPEDLLNGWEIVNST